MPGGRALRAGGDARQGGEDGTEGGWRSINPALNPPVDDREALQADTVHMPITDYLLNGALIALVIMQIRGRRLSLHSILLPLAIVGYVAVRFLHGIPGGAGNLELVATGLVAGASLGTTCGLTTRVFRGVGGAAMAKAGIAAAILWVLGVGARLAFSLYASHGGQPAIARFSIAHHITSGNTWVAALVLMALAEVVCRTAVIAVRYRRLTLVGRSMPGAAPAGAAPAIAASAVVASGHAAGSHAIMEPSANWS